MPTAEFSLIIGALLLGYFIATEIVKRWYHRHIVESVRERGTVFEGSV